MYIDKYELLEAIKEKYGNDSLNDNTGVNAYNSDTNEYVWLSIEAIVNLIEDCQEYDD